MPTKKQIAINAVLRAGELCKRVQAEMVLSDTIQKNDRSPVTIADFGSQAVICKALSETFPNDIIVAEEDAHSLRQNPSLLKRVKDIVNETLGTKVSETSVCDWIDRGMGEVTNSFWTLDPIDGTKGFLRQDQYAIALAWIVDGNVELGVLGCPNLPHRLDESESGRGCLFVAVRGKGAYAFTLEGNEIGKIQVSEETRRLAESFESTHGDSSTHHKIAKQIGINDPPIQVDSQAKYGIVARGEASLYIRLPNPQFPDYRECIWDHAAGLIVVEEAGGKVTDAKGKPLNFLNGRRMTENCGVVATNGTLHKQVLSVISSM